MGHGYGGLDKPKKKKQMRTFKRKKLPGVDDKKEGEGESEKSGEGGESERISDLDEAELAELRSLSDSNSEESVDIPAEGDDKDKDDSNEYPIISADVDLRQGEIRNIEPSLAQKLDKEALDDKETGASFFAKTGQDDPFNLP